jgi:hypothetical protein
VDMVAFQVEWDVARRIVDLHAAAVLAADFEQRVGDLAE